MTSTSFISGAGLKKCMPDDPRRVRAPPRAIAVIGIDEVFDASTAPRRDLARAARTARA